MKDDVELMTVGNLIKLLNDGIESGKMALDTPILRVSDEFGHFSQRKITSFAQLDDDERMDNCCFTTASSHLEDLDYEITRYKKKIDQLSNSNEPNFAINKLYYEKHLANMMKDKKDFKSWIKRNAVVIP